MERVFSKLYDKHTRLLTEIAKEALTSLEITEDEIAAK
jgi:hypothetical protein